MLKGFYYNNCVFFPQGKPDPPQKVDVLEITKNSATVGWVKPMRDGGAKIDGYIIDYLELPMPKPPKIPVAAEGEVEPGVEPVAPPPPEPVVEEKKEEKKEEWTPYTVVKDLSISVAGLKEGRKYRFRVAARNAMGSSLPTETREAYEIKEQMCKLLNHILLKHILNYTSTKNLFNHVISSQWSPKSSCLSLSLQRQEQN